MIETGSPPTHPSASNSHRTQFHRGSFKAGWVGSNPTLGRIGSSIEFNLITITLVCSAQTRGWKQSNCPSTVQVLVQTYRTTQQWRGDESRRGGWRYPLSFRLVLQLVYDSRNFSFEGNRCVLSILLVYEVFRCRGAGKRERAREEQSGSHEIYSGKLG